MMTFNWRVECTYKSMRCVENYAIRRPKQSYIVQDEVDKDVDYFRVFAKLTKPQDLAIFFPFEIIPRGMVKNAKHTAIHQARHDSR